MVFQQIKGWQWVFKQTGASLSGWSPLVNLKSVYFGAEDLGVQFQELLCGGAA